MNIQIYDNSITLAKAAATVIAAQVLAKPASVLGLPTGTSPIETYNQMIALYEAHVVDFSKVTTFNLDEYCGLPITHQESYYFFMMKNLFDKLNVPLANIHLPNGLADDLEAECMEYEQKIQGAGGIDLQLVGIGRNGHLGFNEPSDAFSLDSNVAKLTDSTIEANMRFFDSYDEMPKYALSMGIGTIMRTRRVLLIATGAEKAQAVHDMIKGKVTPQVPASILQFHGDVIVMLDQDAAGLL